jgi:hypothetical protein
MINLKELIIEQLKKKNIDIETIEFEKKEFEENEIVLYNEARTYQNFIIKKAYDMEYFYKITNALELIKFKYGHFKILAHGNYPVFNKKKEFEKADCHICFTILIDQKSLVKLEKQLEKDTKPEPKEIPEVIEIDLTKNEIKKNKKK